MPGSRKTLPRVPPPPVRDSWFFITICCQLRERNQLCIPNLSTWLINSATFYAKQHRWALHLFLLMPDHVHMIAAFPKEEDMSNVIRDWKRLTARGAGIDWQRNYFDHRVRPDEGLDQKTDYIRQNPVRAGLVKHARDWPYCVDYLSPEGR